MELKSPQFNRFHPRSGDPTVYPSCRARPPGGSPRQRYGQAGMDEDRSSPLGTSSNCRPARVVMRQRESSQLDVSVYSKGWLSRAMGTRGQVGRSGYTVQVVHISPFRLLYLCRSASVADTLQEQLAPSCIPIGRQIPFPALHIRSATSSAFDSHHIAVGREYGQPYWSTGA